MTNSTKGGRDTKGAPRTTDMKRRGTGRREGREGRRRQKERVASALREFPERFFRLNFN
jgi:hypothetical protein